MLQLSVNMQKSFKQIFVLLFYKKERKKNEMKAA
jgi:hypothetical protein